MARHSRIQRGVMIVRSSKYVCWLPCLYHRLGAELVGEARCGQPADRRTRITPRGRRSDRHIEVLPNLRGVALGNNPVGKVVEEYAEDALNFEIVRDSISLPPLGRALEEKYAKLHWLHAPSSFRMIPPSLYDI
jgi:hypothetical protein